jgi:hypothetical protein
VKCTGFSTRFALHLCVLVISCACPYLATGRSSVRADEAVAEGVSTREARQLAERGVPFERLNPSIRDDVREVLGNPSYFRRMPSQQIACDPQMFTFLVRRPEVMVNIWEVMGITKVKAQRTSPLTFLADDGVGTACKCDLIYSDERLHIYYGTGIYDGSMAPRKVTGRCVCLLRTQDTPGSSNSQDIVGTMDVFLKVDNFGADLLTRTIGPFVGKTADYNFVETAKFISQISLICQTNPAAAQALVMRLDRIDDATRREFGEIVTRIASTQADQNSLELQQVYQPSDTIYEVSPMSAPAQREKLVVTTSPGGELPAAIVSKSKPNLPLNLPDSTSHGRSTLAAQDHVLNRGSNSLSQELAPPGTTIPAAILPRKSNIYMRR